MIKIREDLSISTQKKTKLIKYKVSDIIKKA